MIDNQALNSLIEQQIQQIVKSEIQARLSGRDLVTEIEQDLIQHAQDRITARFANIADMPDLIDAIKSSVAGLMEQGFIPDIASYVDTSLIKSLVDHKVESLVESIINNLLIDQSWQEKIESQINRQFVLRFSERLSLIDFDSMIGQHIDQSIEKWQHKLLENFATKGIKDTADQVELTVLPQGVNVENTLIARHAVIGQDLEVSGSLTVNSLVLKGSVNVDNRSWDELIENIVDRANQSLTQVWTDDLKQQVLLAISEQGIDFKDIVIDGQPLISDQILNPSIHDTNIQKLGRLRDLTVDGPASLGDTLKVRNQRVGINTDSPDMALSIWDDDVCLSAGKLSKSLAFIGTSRATTLAIGVNRGRQIEIDTDGLVTVKKLRIGNFKVGHEPRVPGYSGARGDIVFNSDPKPGEPFAWQCLGSFQWQPLKAVI